MSARVSGYARYRALGHCFRLGWREAWAQKAGLVSVFAFYAVLIGLWASLWHMADPAVLARAGLSYAQAVWYGAAGELVVFAVSQLYRDIEDDIQGGEVTAFLLRPVGYIPLKIAEALGQALFRMLALGAAMSVFAFVLTGGVPFGVAAMVAMPAMLAVGAMLWLLMQTMIGLLAAWLPATRPVFMVTQKSLFVLGGMIVPLTLFPGGVRALAFATPFPAMLYAASGLIVDASARHVGAMLALQAGWLAALLAATLAVQFLFERRLIARGG